MLEKRDLEAIASLLDCKLENNNVSMKEFVREEISTQITRSESFLLEEMERMNKSTNSKIDSLQKKVDNLEQHYRITKLENDNTTILLQMVIRLQEDVEELKRKTA